MLKIVNPATEEVIQEIKEDSAESINNKFTQAKVGQRKWENVSLQDRIQCILNFKKIITEKKERLAEILTSEVGKPISQSHNELNGLLTRIDFFIENAPKVLAAETVFENPKEKLKEIIEAEPLGVIANISAWNYPYFVGANVFIPALLAGNSVLYKPSEYALLTGIEITNALHEAGIPKDVFLIVLGGAEAGEELLKKDIKGLFFTGSYATGKKIAEKVAGKMIKMQLELGGKDPIYIAEDAEIEVAANATADGAMYNTGQSCCSVERIYVHENIFNSFLEYFVTAVNKFVLGSPQEKSTYIGPLTRPQQISVLENQVKDALSKGAKIICGGKRISEKKGSFFQPTVITDVNHQMLLMKEESFGPIIGIQKVKNDNEAVALMNDTEYGLTAGVYTASEARAKNILKNTNAGSVYWNCCDRVSPRLPWSGRGHSGLGVTLSTQGILAFTQPKAWHLRS